MKLDLRQLRHVLAVERYRNFARAAEAVGITQPALSRSVQALEDAIGARLFDRERMGVEPTAVGVRLIELARPIVAQARDAERELQQMVALDGGLLRVGAGPYVSELSMGTAVGHFARQHPGVLVDLAVGDWPDLYEQLLAEEFEVIVAESSHASQDDRFHIEPLPCHAGFLYARAGHPLATRSDLAIGDIAAYPIATTVMPRRVLDLVGKTDTLIRPHLPDGAGTMELRVEMPHIARLIVMESDVIGIAVGHQIDADLAAGRLVRLPLQLPWLGTSYGIMRLANRTPSPAASAFIAILREVESALDAVPAPAG
jgi:DNA-binding transcriptional LysR family regulator